MKKALPLLLALSLLLSLAGAEGNPPPSNPDLSTPTDLSCAHEHTREVFYFSDPWYTPLDDENHLIQGPAEVELECMDCGEMLSSEFRENAESLRPHSFKKGVCVLCGQLQTGAEDLPELMDRDAPGEHTVTLPWSAGAAPEERRMLIALTEKDLNSMAIDEISLVILRPETGDAAIALDVPSLRSELAGQGGDFAVSVEMSPAGNGELFTAVFVASPSEDPAAEPGSLDFVRDIADKSSVILRFYGRYAVAPVVQSVETGAKVEAEQVLREPPMESFWQAPWPGSGNLKIFNVSY